MSFVYFFSITSFQFEIAKEKRDGLSFWLAACGTIGLVMFVCISAALVFLYNRKTRPGLSTDVEMPEYRRGSRADDLNVTVKREQPSN